MPHGWNTGVSRGHKAGILWLVGGHMAGMLGLVESILLETMFKRSHMAGILRLIKAIQFKS